MSLTKEDKKWILMVLQFCVMTIVIACKGDGLYVREHFRDNAGAWL